MAFELRDIKELAEEVGGLKAAKKLLSQAGVPELGGFYNHGALDSMYHEPKVTNIGKALDKKLGWTLSEQDGVGAIKHLMDTLDLDLTNHQYHHTNWIVARNKRKQRQQIKIYSTSYYANRNERARFTVSGFLTENAPPYYMFLCYQGPQAWVVTRKQLAGVHKKCWDARRSSTEGRYEEETTLGGAGDKVSTVFQIPKKFRAANAGTKEMGRLTITFDPQDSYRLLKKGQLGL